MSDRSVLIVGRLFFGLLTLAAILTQFVVHLRHGFDVVNFFGYFTNLSNIFAAVVFLAGAVYLLQRREPTQTENLVRGASVAAMAVVGIVFAILLRDEDLGTLLPWVNTVLHIIMPVVVVVDWLYAPPKTILAVRQAGYWLIYPLLYLVYTLIRGAIVGFYPYPFLNPAKAGGYGVVALYCIAIFVVFLVVSWLLITLGNALKRTLSLRAA
ncbi:MAG: Pr6Pr family membrane protein [Ktedonobacterales bacterium]